MAALFRTLPQKVHEARLIRLRRLRSSHSCTLGRADEVSQGTCWCRRVSPSRTDAAPQHGRDAQVHCAPRASWGAAPQSVRAWSRASGNRSGLTSADRRRARPLQAARRSATGRAPPWQRLRARSGRRERSALHAAVALVALGNRAADCAALRYRSAHLSRRVRSRRWSATPRAAGSQRRRAVRSARGDE